MSLESDARNLLDFSKALEAEWYYRRNWVTAQKTSMKADLILCQQVIRVKVSAWGEGDSVVSVLRELPLEEAIHHADKRGYAQDIIERCIEDTNTALGERGVA